MFLRHTALGLLVTAALWASGCNCCHKQCCKPGPPVTPPPNCCTPTIPVPVPPPGSVAVTPSPILPPGAAVGPPR